VNGSVSVGRYVPVNTNDKDSPHPFSPTPLLTELSPMFNPHPPHLAPLRMALRLATCGSTGAGLPSTTDTSSCCSTDTDVSCANGGEGRKGTQRVRKPHVTVFLCTACAMSHCNTWPTQ
jgi:hypothetical protein